MGQKRSIFHKRFILLVLLGGAILLPIVALAVVGDVTLTAVPPNTVISFTNETTGEKVEAKTAERDDKDKGVLVIPLGEKKWEAGTYTVTIKESGGRTVSQPVPLRDGSNQIDIGVIVGTTMRTAAEDSKKAEEKRTEEKKTEEKKPSFWESLLPSFSIGVGGGMGGGRERGPRNPCAEKK